MEIPKELFTLDTLATFAGLVAAVWVITYFLKPYAKRLGDWAVRPLALLVAMAIQGFVLWATNALGPDTAGLAVINSFLVALTAAGLHDAVTDPAATKRRDPAP